MTPDELEHACNAPHETAWLAEVQRAEQGECPAPAAFFESVRRLTRISWTLAQVLMEECDMGDELDVKTYSEYLWFHADLIEGEGEEET